MGADLNNIVKFQRLSDEHVQFLIYQLLRGLKVFQGLDLFKIYYYFESFKMFCVCILSLFSFLLDIYN